MKYIILGFFMFPLIASAQTRSDAERVMGRFMKFYNAKQYDSMYAMHSDKMRSFIPFERDKDGMKWYEDSLGKMLSFNYLGIDNEDPEHVFVFKTKWSKQGNKTSSFTLDKENKFGTFRLWTRSDGIDHMLEKEKSSHKK